MDYFVTLCYNLNMKKVTKKELINLLKSRNCTYDELSNITGYHAKSLIRINRQIIRNEYNYIKKKDLIISDYLSGKYPSYKCFYLANKDKYNISYSRICKILKYIELEDEIVVIKKVHKEDANYFIVIDCKTKQKLFIFNSLKNDIKSIKRILFKLLTDFGAPDNICFTNFIVNNSVINTLNKYKINIIPKNSLITNSFKNIKDFGNISYRKCQIDFRDFYNRAKRKTIDTSTIQFNNVRYKIISDKNIKKNTDVIVYYDDNKTDIFVTIEDVIYKIFPHKLLTSKKGLTKY